MTTLRILGLATSVAVMMLLMSLVSWQPGSLYGGAAATEPLPTQQIIAFAPLSSEPFYAELVRDENAGCATPAEWQLKHAHQLPRTMVVQLVVGGQPTWQLQTKPWSFNNIGGYVRLLCK